MKHILALLLPVICEIFIFPNLKEKYITRTLIHFLSILNAVYFTTNSFRENTRYTKLIPVAIMSFDYIFGKFIISQFYDPNCKYFEATHSILTIILALVSYCLFTDKAVFREFETSPVFPVHTTVTDMVFVYKIFYFYKYFHLKQGNRIDLSYDIDLVIRISLNLLVNNTFFVVNNLLCFYLSPRKSSTPLLNIFKRFIFMLLAEFVFYSIYSFKLARAVFEFSHGTFIQQNFLILYNILPKELDIRFRVFLYTCNWILT
jgi:hypothetical protein